MAKKAIGLSKVEMGDVGADGGMGSSLNEVGATVSDNAIMQNDAPTVTDFNIEEQDDPFYSLSVPGKLTVKWSSYNTDLEALSTLLGGTYTAATSSVGGKWDMPDSVNSEEQSLKLTTKDGWTIEIPRAKIDVILTWNLQKTKLAQVDYTATVLKPTKDDTAKVTFTDPYKSAT